ncbi:MAG: thioredoxin domain-containing protein, partial [Eubacteriaceae bacterium]
MLNYKYTNSLSSQTSPYLLQHAHNPVNWYPWGAEAFEKAKNEDKPIFLSIGYSTCHWCHVMEHESFEDDEVADILNEHFVSIKVDREQRPDIDSVYMRVCQMLTGAGGWPLSIFLTPDQKPFYAGTYFPKNSIHNMLGLTDLLAFIAEKWRDAREDLIASGNKITEILTEDFEHKNEILSENLDEIIIDEAFS